MTVFEQAVGLCLATIVKAVAKFWHVVSLVQNQKCHSIRQHPLARSVSGLQITIIDILNESANYHLDYLIKMATAIVSSPIKESLVLND